MTYRLNPDDCACDYCSGGIKRISADGGSYCPCPCHSLLGAARDVFIHQRKQKQADFIMQMAKKMGLIDPDATEVEIKNPNQPPVTVRWTKPREDFSVFTTFPLDPNSPQGDTSAPASADPLTEKQRWLLTKLMEECAETIQAAAKVLVHGPDDWYAEHGCSNREHLTDEVADMRVFVNELFDQGIIVQSREAKAYQRKWEIIRKRIAERFGK